MCAGGQVFLILFQDLPVHQYASSAIEFEGLSLTDWLQWICEDEVGKRSRFASLLASKSDHLHTLNALTRLAKHPFAHHYRFTHPPHRKALTPAPAASAHALSSVVLAQGQAKGSEPGFQHPALFSNARALEVEQEQLHAWELQLQRLQRTPKRDPFAAVLPAESDSKTDLCLIYTLELFHVCRSPL
jgi:hypothetical protein